MSKNSVLVLLLTLIFIPISPAQAQQAKIRPLGILFGASASANSHRINRYAD
jgi:hypothetical protein